MPKFVKVLLSSVERTIETQVESSTTGKQLLEEVSKALGINEDWYFGLQYRDRRLGGTDKRWLKLEKKILTQDVFDGIEPLQMNILVQFYPEDSAEEILEPVTLRLFYLQVKNDVAIGDIVCPLDTSLQLDSLSLQVNHGDYNEFSQLNQTTEVVEAWKKHSGMYKEDAMREYLKIVQNLETYGMSYHSIKNKKGTEVWLGIDALGLKIYAKENKLEPKIGFSWSELSNITYHDKKMRVKMVDKGVADLSFKTEGIISSKEILALCTGNHEMYMMRRRPDTPKLAALKERCREERLSRERRAAIREGRAERRLSNFSSNHVLETQKKLEKDGKQRMTGNSGREWTTPVDPPLYEEAKLSYYRSSYKDDSQKLTSL